jgi:hypothetical protein
MRERFGFSQVQALKAPWLATDRTEYTRAVTLRRYLNLSLAPDLVDTV